MKPKISVIMSVYNGMPYLKEAVESILKQSYKNFEFIVVDDSSTDKSWQYLKSIKDKRLKLLKNKKNLGIASSLNKALKIANGVYIARMDSDDISDRLRLEYQLKFLEDHNKIDICGTYAIVINENGETVGHIKKPRSNKGIKKELVWLTPLLHPTWFAKKSIFDKLNGYSKEWDYVEDFEFLIRARDFNMANVNKNLLFLRRQTNRRSQAGVEKIYKKSLALRMKIFKEQKTGFSYLVLIARSYVSTYLFPTWLKIYLNKPSK